MNILKNKAAKSCSIPAESVADAEKMKEWMTQLVQLSQKVSLSDPARRKQILQCNAACLCIYLKSLQHALQSDFSEASLQAAQALVKETVGVAVTDFTSKRSHLSLQFLETLFGRYPLLCAGFVESLQPLVTEGSLGNYKRLELVALLTGLLQHARGGPLQQTVGVLRGYREPLEAVRAWAQDKLEHRAEEGYEDFRKQPRRKVLNDFCRALEALMAEKAPKKAKKEEKGVEKKGEEKKGVEKEEKKEAPKAAAKTTPKTTPKATSKATPKATPKTEKKERVEKKEKGGKKKVQGKKAK